MKNVLLFYFLVLFYSSCQYANEARVKNGRQFFYTKVHTDSTLKGKVKADYFDADYKLVREMVTMSSYVYSCAVDKITSRPIYLGYDCRKGNEPKEDIELAYISINWERFDVKTPFPATPNKFKKVKGFAYDVWVSKSEPKIAVIVMRGTDFKEIGDWESNLRWATQFIPRKWDHYEQVRALIPNLVKEIDEKFNGKIRIFTAGHSLGGGLAQHACYASTRIEKVFAFDPSPVTSFYSIPRKQRLHTKENKTIYRVYEKGEVLSIIRYPLSLFHPLSKKNPKIVQIRYNMYKNMNPVSEHSISLFAKEVRNYVPKIFKK